jgi:hypothetical protein
MGMLFNTPGTNDVISAANYAFRNAGAGTGIARLRADPTWADAFGILPAATGAGGHNPHGGTLNLVTSLPDPIQPSGAHPGARPRWRQWLNLFDTQTNVLDPGNYVAETVGMAIKAALNDNTYTQIEFFAVPDAINNFISAEAHDFYDDNSGEWSVIITIHTNTWDKISGSGGGGPHHRLVRRPHRHRF